MLGAPNTLEYVVFIIIILAITQLYATVGLNDSNWSVMHGTENMKFVNAQQAKQIYRFKYSLMMGQ